MADEFQIPVGVVTYEVYQYVHSIGGVTNVTVEGWDPNPWDLTYIGWPYITFIVLYFGIFLINIVFAVYRIVRWLYKQKRCEISIGLTCLCLECIFNTLKAMGAIINPSFNNFHLNGSDTFTSLPACINLISAILVVFFWIDLTSDPFYHGKFLGAMKIPAFIIIVLLILMEVTLDILRTTQSTIDTLTISLSFYLIIHFIVVLFNIIAGYRFLNTIKEKTDMKKRSSCDYKTYYI